MKSKHLNNIHYNVAIVGRYAIHNFKYTDKNILDYIEKNNLIKINLNKGYLKYSICIVDENSIIIYDERIFNSLKKSNIDCLLIEKYYIHLEEKDYSKIKK